MTVVRVEKRENPYVILDKTALNDNRLTWKAKGLHAYLISKPDGWRVIVGDLVKQSQDGKHACYSALKELETFGYLKRFPVRDEMGTIERWESVIYEVPLLPGFQDVDNLHQANQDVGNREDKYIKKEPNNNFQQQMSHSDIVVENETVSPLPIATPSARATGGGIGEFGNGTADRKLYILDRLKELNGGQRLNPMLTRRISSAVPEAGRALQDLEDRITQEQVDNPLGAFTTAFKLYAPDLFPQSKKGKTGGKNAQEEAIATAEVERIHLDKKGSFKSYCWAPKEQYLAEMELVDLGMAIEPGTPIYRTNEVYGKWEGFLEYFVGFKQVDERVWVDVDRVELQPVTYIEVSGVSVLDKPSTSVTRYKLNEHRKYYKPRDVVLDLASAS